MVWIVHIKSILGFREKWFHFTTEEDAREFVKLIRPLHPLAKITVAVNEV